MFSVLSKHIDDLDKTTSLWESDVPDRVATIGHIETLVRRELHADAEVEVFGSSAVGTDLPKSDVDIASTTTPYGRDGWTKAVTETRRRTSSTRRSNPT